MNEQQAINLRRWLSAIAADVIESFVGPVDRTDASDSRGPRDGEESWDHLTEWRAVEPLLPAMPLVHREVLSLRFRDGLAYRDIATRLGVPVGTVHSRLARARDRAQALQAGTGSGSLAPSAMTWRGVAPPPQSAFVDIATPQRPPETGDDPVPDAA